MLGKPNDQTPTVEIPDASQTTTPSNYYKPTENPWTFKLAHLDSKENQSIWDNTKKTYFRDEIVDAAGRVQKVKNAMYMSKDKFEVAFPNCQKNNRHDRDVIINGESLRYGFKHTQNEQIKQQIETITNLGQDPLSMVFTVLKKTKSGNVLTKDTAFHDVEYQISARLDTGMAPAEIVAPGVSSGSFQTVKEQVHTDQTVLSGESNAEPVEVELMKKFQGDPSTVKNVVAWVEYYRDECLKSNVYIANESELRAGQVWKWLVAKE